VDFFSKYSRALISRKSLKFEDSIRRNRHAIPIWIKYAMWEETQLEFDRARSVWERSLEIDHRNTTIWLKYAEMEMRHRYVSLYMCLYWPGGSEIIS
jgi:crooked neck